MWTRDCPSCGKELSYTQEKGLKAAIKNNKSCKSCVKKGKIFSEEHRLNLAIAQEGKTYSEESRRKMSESRQNFKHTKESRRKISIGNVGNGKLDRKWPKHVAWAKRVKERDGCCQKCQSTEDLHAHHLIPRALMPQYYDVDANGITLCKSCHIELHKILR